MILSSGCPRWPSEQSSNPAEDRHSSTTPRGTIPGVGTLSHGDFSGRLAQLGIWGQAAETLTAGSRSVDQAIAPWKASPGHNANLLMLQARHIGLARADSEGSRYGRYWALVLAQ